MVETEKRLQEAIVSGDKYLIELLQVKLENYYKLIMVEGERFARTPKIFADDPLNSARRASKK